MRNEFNEIAYGSCCESCSQGLPCEAVSNSNLKFQRREPLQVFSYESNLGSDSNMGGLWSSIKNAISDVANVVKKVVISPTDQFIHDAAGFVKTGVIQKLDSWDDLKYIGSKVIVPQSYMMELYAKVPILNKVTKEFDRVSGGLYSDIRISINIPGKVVRGEKVTPYELATALQTGLKVGMIAASGGSAAAIIGVTSGQLKKGVLGESESGRKILGVIEIAAYATAAGQSIGEIAKSEAEKRALSKVEKTALEKTPLGESYLGQSLVKIGGGVYTDGLDGATNLVTNYAKQEAVNRLPNGDYLVKYGPYVYKGASQIDFDTEYPTVDDMIAKAQNEIAREIKNIQAKAINKVEEFPSELRAKVEAAVTARIMKEVAEAEGLLIAKLLGQGKTPNEIKDEILKRQQSPDWQRYLENKKAIDTGIMVLAGGATMALIAMSLKKSKSIGVRK